jgi:hypothetical protein
MKTQKPIPPGSAARACQAGEMYSFRTSPATDFAPRETQRYAALKILGLKGRCVCYVALNGVFDRHPDLAEVVNLPWLINTRFGFGSHPEPACRCVPLDWEIDLVELRYLGSVLLSREDAKLLAECRSYGAFCGASHDSEGEWRWQNDRSAYQEEVEREEQLSEKRLAAERQRYQQRLKALSWEKRLQEEAFSRWQEHPPFPPPEFVIAARAQIRATVMDLRALGPKPKKAAVRAVLKARVGWFNAKDAEFGNVIETEEREDICAVLEELAFVAGHRSLVSEIDAWRDW